MRFTFRFQCLAIALFCMLFAGFLAVACAQTAAAPAVATPWWAELMTAALPALVVFVVKEIRSHVKDQTIERIATLAATAKKYEPLAADIFTAIEAKYPTLKADAAKVQAATQTPLAQAGIQAAESIAAGLKTPAPGV